MCYYMNISKNVFYHWLKMRDKPIKETTTAFLLSRIVGLFKGSRENYCSYRLQKMLEREKLFYSRSYVAVLMRKLGLRSISRRKFVVTKDSNHNY